jgi:hypothetical protein
MQHFIKQFRRFSWVLAVFTMSAFFYACKADVKKEEPKEEPKVEQPALQATPSTIDTPKKRTDSLPPVDKKAGTRPEDAGT